VDPTLGLQNHQLQENLTKNSLLILILQSSRSRLKKSCNALFFPSNRINHPVVWLHDPNQYKYTSLVWLHAQYGVDPTRFLQFAYVHVWFMSIGMELVNISIYTFTRV